MADKPRNKVPTGEISGTEDCGGNEKLKAVKGSYRCDNYIQAIAVKETLENTTGKEYDILKSSITGWKVTAKY